jgi:hypothetical protein
VYLACAVDEVVLVEDVHCFGFVEAACSKDLDVGGGVYVFACLLDEGDAVAHVAAEGDEGAVGEGGVDVREADSAISTRDAEFPDTMACTPTL